MYNKSVKIEFDPAKNAYNIKERGLPFDDVAHLDWASAVFNVDNRKDYGERRIRAIVNDLKGVAHHVTFTLRDNGNTMRVISFRLAREKERKRYEKET